jgi:hypothetical protein
LTRMRRYRRSFQREVAIFSEAMLFSLRGHRRVRACDRFDSSIGTRSEFQRQKKRHRT